MTMLLLFTGGTVFGFLLVFLWGFFGAWWRNKND